MSDPGAENETDFPPAPGATPEQREGYQKLKLFLRAMKLYQPPHRGASFAIGNVDEKGVAQVQLVVRDGLREAQTVVFECRIFHDSYPKFAELMAREYAALHYRLFLKTYAPDLYTGPEVNTVTEFPTIDAAKFM